MGKDSECLGRSVQVLSKWDMSNGRKEAGLYKAWLHICPISSGKPLKPQSHGGLERAFFQTVITISQLCGRWKK